MRHPLTSYLVPRTVPTEKRATVNWWADKLAGFTVSPNLENLYVGKQEGIYEFPRIDAKALRTLCLQVLRRLHYTTLLTQWRRTRVLYCLTKVRTTICFLLPKYKIGSIKQAKMAFPAKSTEIADNLKGVLVTNSIY